jgi:hypothetical protein
MDLPRWQRQVVPSGSAGGALADPQALSRPVEALKILGDVATEQGERWAYQLDNIIANNQLGKFTIEAENAMLNIQLGDDPAGFEDKYDELYERIKGEHLAAVTHPEARRAAEQWLAGKDIDWRAGVRDNASKTLIAEGKAVYAAARKLGRERGDIELLASATNRAVQGGIISAEEGELNLASDLGDTAKDAALAAAKAVYESTGSVTAAIKAIEADDNVRQTDKDTLFEDVKTYAAAMKAGDEQEKYHKKEALKKELIKLKFSDSAKDLLAAREMVKNSGDALTAGEMETELDDIGARIKAMAEGRDDPYKKHNEEVYLGLLRRANNPQPGQEKLTETEIAGYVGKVDKDGRHMGISTDDYKELVKLITSDAMGNQTFKNLLSSLDDMHRAGHFLDRPFRNDPTGSASVMESGRFLESMHTLSAVQKAFTNWMINNPTATDAQIVDKFRALTRPRDADLAAMGLEAAWTKEGGWQRMFKYLRENTPEQTKAAAAGITPEKLDAYDKSVWEMHRAEGGSWDEFLQLKKEAFLEDMGFDEEDSSFDEPVEGEQVEVGGVVYTYKGNGEWEY